MTRESDILEIHNFIVYSRFRLAAIHTRNPKVVLLYVLCTALFCVIINLFYLHFTLLFALSQPLFFIQSCHRYNSLMKQHGAYIRNFLDPEKPNFIAFYTRSSVLSYNLIKMSKKNRVKQQQQHKTAKVLWYSTHLIKRKKKVLLYIHTYINTHSHTRVYMHVCIILCLCVCKQ